jgi:hypothetical protein
MYDLRFYWKKILLIQFKDLFNSLTLFCTNFLKGRFGQQQHATFRAESFSSIFWEFFRKDFTDFKNISRGFLTPIAKSSFTSWLILPLFVRAESASIIPFVIA